MHLCVCVCVCVCVRARTCTHKQVTALSHCHLSVVNMRRTVRRAETHVYIFEGFPELTEKRDYMFSLEADVVKAIEGVIVEPQRIELIENVGCGETHRLSIKARSDVCDVVSLCR